LGLAGVRSEHGMGCWCAMQMMWLQSHRLCWVAMSSVMQVCLCALYFAIKSIRGDRSGPEPVALFEFLEGSSWISDVVDGGRCGGWHVGWLG